MEEIQRPSRQQLLALKGTSLQVPALLALFGMRLRNHQTVPVIAEALSEVGLNTVPSFTTCGFGTEVFVVAAEYDDSPGETTEEEFSPGALPQQSFKIGDIPSARGGVDSVPSSAPLSQATYLMKLRNYSQLPVIDGMSDLRGVITWSSIAARYEMGEMPSLASAMVKDSLPVAEVHQELFPRLPEVAEYGYLLVRSNSGSIDGIVTAADITGRFHAIARPFFLVGEIEFRLRRCLGAKLTGDPVRAVQQRNRQTGDISDLMFGDYVKLLDADQNDQRLRGLADSNWLHLGWTGVNRAQFVHQLKRVKSIRNQIAHFDDTPLSEQQLADLIEFSGLLKHLI
ncbi:CBS domain-containing protein [Dactylosporangium sp. NPDC000555]|uniref:CBS domain-containing protein n=1 Tax=Dactylosporangium sp. NPDC000555 TaxID=3154260 RepID=UPI0033200350